jgi:hypothetical protein
LTVITISSLFTQHKHQKGNDQDNDPKGAVGHQQ